MDVWVSNGPVVWGAGALSGDLWAGLGSPFRSVDRVLVPRGDRVFWVSRNGLWPSIYRLLGLNWGEALVISQW